MEEKKLSIATRRKLARVAKRTAKKRQLKRKLMAKRPKSGERLKKAAQKAAKNVLVKKMTGGKSYSDLSITQKQTLDTKLKPSIIARVAKKMLPKIRAKEKERLKKMKQKTDEQFGVSKHKVGGGEMNVSGVNKNGNIEPLKFDNKEDAKKHSKEVGGKIIQDKDGTYYVEFTKIDGPVNKTLKMEDKEKEENLKDLKAILDVAQLLSSDSAYFKGRGSKKEYIKMILHKIRKLSESKKHFYEIIKVPIEIGDIVLGGRFKNKKLTVKSIGKNEKGDITINNKPLLKYRLTKQTDESNKKPMTRMDAYKKVRKPTLPKSRPMQSKKKYNRADFKKGKYD